MKLNLLEILGLLSPAFAFFGLYKQHLQGADVVAHVGDSVGLPLHTDGRTHSVHLDCTFTNGGARTGVIQKLVLLCTNPAGKRTRFDWELFYTYKGMSTTPSERPHSIAVHSRNSAFLHIQFNCEGDYDWTQGKHQFELLGWVDRDSVEKPNLKKLFSIALEEGQSLVMDNKNPPPRNASIVPFQIEEARVEL